MNKVGIIIPTLNRLDFVERLIKYYLFCNDQVSVYIGDASNNDSSNKLKSIIDNKSVCKIYYYHFPKLNDAKTIYKLSTLVKEKYLCFSGDDDFFITKSLIKCVNFLEKNENYSCVQGRTYIFETKSNKLYEQVLMIHNHLGKIEILQNNSHSRALKLSKNYYVPEFSVHRTKQFIKDKKPSIEILDRNIREYISSFNIIINGRSKFLDCIYLMRQHHPIRGESTISNHYSNKKTSKIFDTNSLNDFKNYLKNKLVEKDKISQDYSRKILLKIIKNLNIYEDKSKDFSLVFQNVFRFFKYMQKIFFRIFNFSKKRRFQNVDEEYEAELNKFLSFIENNL